MLLINSVLKTRLKILMTGSHTITVNTKNKVLRSISIDSSLAWPIPLCHSSHILNYVGYVIMTPWSPLMESSPLKNNTDLFYPGTPRGPCDRGKPSLGVYTLLSYENLLAEGALIWNDDVAGLKVYTDISVFVLLDGMLKTRSGLLLERLKLHHGRCLQSNQQ